MCRALHKTARRGGHPQERPERPPASTGIRWDPLKCTGFHSPGQPRGAVPLRRVFRSGWATWCSKEKIAPDWVSATSYGLTVEKTGGLRIPSVFQHYIYI